MEASLSLSFSLFLPWLPSTEKEEMYEKKWWWGDRSPQHIDIYPTKGTQRKGKRKRRRRCLSLSLASFSPSPFLLAASSQQQKEMEKGSNKKLPLSSALTLPSPENEAFIQLCSHFSLLCGKRGKLCFPEWRRVKEEGEERRGGEQKITLLRWNNKHVWKVEAVAVWRSGVGWFLLRPNANSSLSRELNIYPFFFPTRSRYAAKKGVSQNSQETELKPRFFCPGKAKAAAKVWQHGMESLISEPPPSRETPIALFFYPFLPFACRKKNRTHTRETDCYQTDCITVPLLCVRKL